MTIKALSLFACSGIGELKLSDNNIETVVANELLLDRCNFYKENFPSVNMICGNISDPLIQQQIVDACILNKVEYVQATPPCQGFSQAGKMNDKDVRNYLIIDTINVILQIKPKWILIENVPQFVKNNIIIDGNSINIIDYIKQKLVDYNIIYKILDTADYGIAQTRRRAIVLISHKDAIQMCFPQILTTKKTVRDVLYNLPSLESGQKSHIPYHYAIKHNQDHITWMKNTPTGKTAFDNPVHYPQKDGRVIKGFKTTYKRIEWDRPSPTITMCNGAISSQNNVHPGRLLPDGTYSDARVLTIYELMLLTGIADLWKIPSWANETLIRRMLGESVPPCIPYEITKQLKDAPII